MQQLCSTCGTTIQPGSTVCTNCGTPVRSSNSGSYGAGSYDPTIRASAPPPGYGQPGFGVPPSPNFGAPPPPHFGAPPPNFGAPPPPNFGAPPPPNFGAPPPNLGAPPPVYPVMQPPKKSQRGLFFTLGGVGVGIILLIVACVALTSLFRFKQEISTGAHVTAVHTGTSFDEQTGDVIGEKDTFHLNDEVWIVYTVTNPDPGAQVVLKLYLGSDFESASPPVDLDNHTNTYANSVVVHNKGEHKVEIYYNGTQEASITFNVTS